jgi:F0F1-type ATP synthase delta subunit
VKRQRAAAPYAKALLELEAEPVGRELDRAVATFEGVAELRDFFARPWILASDEGGAASASATPKAQVQ